MSHRSDRADRAELAVPGTGHGPGVLVLALHAGRGDLAREACARLARHGFVAWAPELPGDGSAAPSEAERSAVDSAIERLFCEHATDGARVGALGFGRGGWLALDAAARSARVAAAICLDGEFDLAAIDRLALARVEAPVLVVLGEKDPAVARGDADALERRLRAEGIACELRIQPGAETGFLDPARADRFDAAAARAAWDAALARLRAEL